MPSLSPPHTIRLHQRSHQLQPSPVLPSLGPLRSSAERWLRWPSNPTGGCIVSAALPDGCRRIPVQMSQIQDGNSLLLLLLLHLEALGVL